MYLYMTLNCMYVFMHVLYVCPQIQTADWSKLASDRLAVDVVIQVLKARAILRHKAYIPWRLEEVKPGEGEKIK